MENFGKVEARHFTSDSATLRTRHEVLYCVKCSGITEWGPEGRTATLGKLNAKTGLPLGLYFSFVIFWFSVSCFFRFYDYFPVM